MEKFIRNITVVEDKARNIRINHGLTQKEFGEILGISKSYVSDIENGYTGLSVEHINKICNNYNVSFDYIMGLSNTLESYEEINVNAKVIGNNLKKFRKDKKLPQKAIFTELNTTSSTWSAYETGKVIIKTDFLYTVCKKYNLSVDKMLSSKDTNA